MLSLRKCGCYLVLLWAFGNAPAVARADERPFWTEKTQWIEGDELKVTGISSNATSREVGRQRAYENAVKEIENFFSSIGDVGQIRTQMTFEEKNEDGTFTVYRLLRVDLSGLERRRFQNRFSSQLGHQVSDVGAIKIVTIPAAAEVYLDADLVGRSNAELGKVGAGSYQVHLRLANYRAKTLNVTVSKAKTNLIAETLERKTESISVNGTAGATIKVKGRESLATIPSELSSLEVGRKYQIHVEKNGYYPQDREIEIFDGMNSTIDVTLEPMPGELTVLAEPEGSEIAINGESIGVSPLRSLKLRPEPLEIVVSKPGYLPKTIKASVEPLEKKLIADVKLVSLTEKEKYDLNPSWRLSLGIAFAGNSSTNSALSGADGCCAGWQLGLERKVFDSIGFGVTLGLFSSGESNSSKPSSVRRGEVGIAMPIYFNQNFYAGPEVGSANSAYGLNSILTDQTFIGAVVGFRETFSGALSGFANVGVRQFQNDGSYEGASTALGSVGLSWGF